MSPCGGLPPVGRRGNRNPSLVMMKGDLMTTKDEPVIRFGTNENWAWHSDTEEVRFTVWDDASNREIECRVTRKFIEDHCGNHSGPDACLTAAKIKCDPITDQVMHYIGIGRFEPDRSILLRSADWPST